eukprot:5829459-Prymnesium_polylepis.1
MAAYATYAWQRLGRWFATTPPARAPQTRPLSPRGVRNTESQNGWLLGGWTRARALGRGTPRAGM